MGIAIIGGGILGVTLAYRLAEAGADVTIYERGQSIGGLASFMLYNETRIDRFYHTILSSDLSMQTLIRESDVADRLHFTETKQAFYDGGRLYSFNTPIELMTYPPLHLIQRIRLALQIVAAQFERDAHKMDQLPVEQWLMRVSGRGVWQKVWKPMLRAKFDSEAVNVPATYIWSRLRRMMSTRRGVTSKEMMCYLEGGYFTLVEAIAHCAESRGVRLHTGVAVEEVVIEAGKVVGLRTAEGVQPYDVVISTLPSPLLAQIIPAAPQSFRDLLTKQEYLGVICPLLILKQRLTPYYVLNITDETIPFTAVVETTNLIDPAHVGDYHLVYLPKYIAPNSPLIDWSDEKIQTEWMQHFTRMFPDFDTSQIEAFIVQRARYVEPLRPIGTTGEIPTIQTPVAGLYMGNTVMVYPELNNGESVTQLAGRVAETIGHGVSAAALPVKK